MFNKNREFTGDALISFLGITDVRGKFFLDFENSGDSHLKSTILVPMPVSNFIKIFRVLEKNFNQYDSIYATLSGTTRENGYISISNCILNGIKLNFYKKNVIRSTVTGTDLANIDPAVLAVIKKIASMFALNEYNIWESIEGSIDITFEVMSDIVILYDHIANEQLVSSIYGLTNLQFGIERYNYGVNSYQIPVRINQRTILIN